MTDHFQGTNHIELQPQDNNVPLKFKFNAASASTANDGSMPYGSTVKSVVSTIKDSYGIDATTSLILSSALNGNSVIVYLKHSTAVQDGLYTLTLKMGFALQGTTSIFTREFDFRRVILRNE